MKFDDLDEKMRVYETAFDQCAVPGMFWWRGLIGAASRG